jgi:xylulokinase
MPLILVHDLGTSGNKASLFDETGRLLASITITYETFFPGRGEAEQNPEDWWRAVCESTKSVLNGYSPYEVAAIGLSGHMMGCLPLDRNDSESTAMKTAISTVCRAEV